MCGGQVVWVGGPHVRVNKSVQPICQGQAVGRCRVMVRAVVAIRAGTPIRVRRTVPVVALASRVPASAAAPRVRLNAIAANTSHAEFAVNDPDVIWSPSECVRDVHQGC